MKRSLLPELLILLGAAVLRFGFALLPLDLLAMLLEDDAWMVAAIARHWAIGNRITADGVNPTNGFHPLYPLTLGALPYLAVPTAALEHLQAGFRVNLLICAALSTLTLLPFYAMLRHAAPRPLALAGLALLAFNPLLIQVSVNAMETSLALLLLVTLWWQLLTRPAPELSLVQAAGLGGLAGLTILARLDNALAVAYLGLWLVWQELRARQWPIRSVTFGGVAGLVLLPYFARNWLIFESLSPSSGRALAYMHSYSGSFTYTSGLQLLAYPPALDLTTAPQWMLALGILGLAGMYLTLPRAQRGMFTPLVLYSLTLALYYGYVQQQGRPRYYVTVAFVIVLLVCAWLAAQLATRPQAIRLVPVGAAAVVAVLIGYNSLMWVRSTVATINAPYQAQPAMFAAARWMSANLPEDAVIAAQNSGIFQYYSNRLVINIDGKLNHEIVPILEQRQLDRYLHARGVEYVVDLPSVAGYIEFYSASLSDARPHRELSALEKLGIHARRFAARIGIGAPVVLPERVPERVIVPFSDVSQIVQEFPLPNDPDQAVTIYLLLPQFGATP